MYYKIVLSRLTENRPKTEVFCKTETETDFGFPKTDKNENRQKNRKTDFFRFFKHVWTFEDYNKLTHCSFTNRVCNFACFSHFASFASLLNQSQYPTLAVVARSYLSIPSTSVASERVFSKCGRVCSERRSLLSPEHVEQLVFLSQNLST